VASPQPCVRRALQPSESTASPTGSRPGHAIGRLGNGLLVAVAASLAVAVLPGSASAAPGGATTRATTPEQATQLVTGAQHELEANMEALNEAKEVLAQQQAQADAAAEAGEEAEARRAALDTQMRQVARSAFRGENLSRLNALMTSGSADEFLSQVTTLDALAGHTSDVLAEADAAAAAAAQAKAEAEAAVAAARQTMDQVTSDQAALDDRIADYRSQFQALSAAQQQEVVEEHAGPVLDAPAKTTSRSMTSTTATPTATPTATATATNDAAQTAVDTALAQLGDPYVWGAGGPDAFDCSGLTQYAYAAVGVTLPHSSRIQSTMGTPVSRADLQPGDLVFFYSPVSHVGMYIGQGKMVHASTFGSPVIVSTVDMAGYVGARRLVG
jgi:cell wall-associated NlpC family hydrolase